MAIINYNILLAFNYSIVIAVLIGLIRYRRIHRSYHPFVFITMFALAGELASTITIKYYGTNEVVINIYSIIEFIMWCWQFERWKKRPWHSNSSKILFVLILIAWISATLIFGRITEFHELFGAAYSFYLVFAAINQINKLIIEEKNYLLRNAKFLICLGVLVFYTYKIMVDSLSLFQLDQSQTFFSNIYLILVFVNLFVNLLYALAILWIPARQRFTLQY